MWWKDILRCPVCGAETNKEGNSLFCCGVKRHCFDFSADGYLNLAAARSAGGGDDATLIAARTAFLSRGYYAPLATRIGELLHAHVDGNCVVDAGCGEGYYTCKLAAEGFHILGVDLSKRGVRAAARAARRAELDALFAVASVYTLPVGAGTADAVISLFAPIAEQELLRVLKPGGILIAVGAGRDHLLSLKRVLYDTPRENEARADLPTKMTELHAEVLDFTMELDPPAIESLFAMTPYYYRTSVEGKARLAALRSLTCEAQMDIHVYQKPRAATE